MMANGCDKTLLDYCWWYTAIRYGNVTTCSKIKNSKVADTCPLAVKEMTDRDEMTSNVGGKK